MTKQYQIGIIGAGNIARQHLEALSQVEEAKVLAISDINMNLAENLAKQFQLPIVTDNYHRLLVNPDIEVVIITTPNFLHGEMTIRALQAGKHVLCEKPMAINEEEARRILEFQKKANRYFMVALNNRFRSDVKAVKQFIRDRELGDIYHIKTGWMRRSGVPKGTWFTNHQLSGGGPLIDLGVHMLDLALYFLGNLKPVSVSSASFMPQKNDFSTDPGRVYNVEHFLSAFIRFQHGLSLTLDVSWEANIETDKRFIELIGTKGGVKLTDDDLVYIYEENFQRINKTFKNLSDDKVARVEMHKHFLTCINTNTQPIIHPEQSVLINEIIDATYKAAKFGSVVTL